MPNTNAAAHALDAYTDRKGLSNQYGSTQVMVTDLICDLLHLLKEREKPPHNANPQAAIATALDRFGKETP